MCTGRARSKASDDDDDFIVPSDSEVETKSTKSSSSRSSGASRRPGVASSEDEDDFEQDEDEEPKKKRKSSGKSRSSQAKGNSKALANSGATGGSATFLTAAEQREQDKKEEKKSAESPYSFLADNVRDVRKKNCSFPPKFIKCIVKQKEGRKPDDPDYDPRTLYVPPKAWSTFTPFEKQVRSSFSHCKARADLQLVLGGWFFRSYSTISSPFLINTVLNL